MSAVGLKPIVEVQFADYIWRDSTQLFTEVSRSCYFVQQQVSGEYDAEVPIGAYGGGGPYHSSSVESVVANIRGIKIAYPSNGADLFGLLESSGSRSQSGSYIWAQRLVLEQGQRYRRGKDSIAIWRLHPSIWCGQWSFISHASSLQYGPAVLIVTYGMGCTGH